MKTEQEIREARELFVAAFNRHKRGDAASISAAMAAVCDWILGQNEMATKVMDLQLAHLRVFFTSSTKEELLASCDECLEKARILEDDYRHRN